MLANLRRRWDMHSPTNPFCLADDLGEGMSIADFCVSFLLTQRTRRLSVVKSSKASKESSLQRNMDSVASEREGGTGEDSSADDEG